ncbi:MAG: response regulator [Labrys sp. (in: a-proteobacteria)]
MATLVAISVAMVAAISTMLFGLSERQAEVRASIREDALWAAYQLDRETNKLIGALLLARARPDEPAVDELQLRFDILVSRVHVFEEGDFGSHIAEGTTLKADVSDVHAGIEGLTPAFGRITGTGVADAPTLDMLLKRLSKIRTLTERILLTINRRQIETEVGERDTAQRHYMLIAAAVIVLAIALGGIILMLMRQLRQIERSRQDLEVLSAKHARAAAEADSGNRAKTAFLATMSHEIRTPLNGIIGSVDLLDASNLPPSQQIHLETIQECGNALTAIISDLLDFSKLEAGSLDLEKRAFPLDKLVEGVVDIVSPRARLKDIGLVALYPSATVEGDLTRLRQILLNLAGNAVKFTDRGDVVIEAKVLATETGGTVLKFVVTDTGIGIAPAATERLFKEFSQGDASITRRFGGTGLGLAISARLVAAMGGEIGVDSEAGTGSKFWFQIPLPCRLDTSVANETSPMLVCAATPAAQAALDTVFHQHPETDRGSSSHDGDTPPLLVDTRRVIEPVFQGDVLRRAIVYGAHATIYAGLARAIVEGPLTLQRLKFALQKPADVMDDPSSANTAAERHSGTVLVVEDNPVNQRIASGLLEKMGVTVEIASDGVEAVARVAKGGLDLVLMDMQMPRMDGLEATRQIRMLEEPARSVAIVGLTANAFVSDREECLKAGMDGFSTKPINREKLQEILREWLPAHDQVPAPTSADKPSESQMLAALAEMLGLCAPIAPATQPPIMAIEAEATAPKDREDDLIDRQQQQGLIDELGQETLDQLTASFWTDLDTLLPAIENGGADQSTVRRTLHTIKGTAESVGYSAIAKASERVRETLVTTGALSTEPIRAAMRRTRDHLDRATETRSKAA